MHARFDAETPITTLDYAISITHDEGGGLFGPCGCHTSGNGMMEVAADTERLIRMAWNHLSAAINEWGMSTKGMGHLRNLEIRGRCEPEEIANRARRSQEEA